MLRRRPRAFQQLAQTGEALACLADCARMIEDMPAADSQAARELDLAERIVQARGQRSAGGPAASRPIGLVVCIRTGKGLLSIHQGSRLLAGMLSLAADADQAGDELWATVVREDTLVRLIAADTPSQADALIRLLAQQEHTRRACDLPVAA
jgi:hypothetical protein